MTTARKTYVKLPSPPEHAGFGDLLRVLLERGVRPPTTGKAGIRWSFIEFSHAIGLREKEAKQVRRYIGNQSLPRNLVQIQLALFGSDAADYPEWRKSLTAALGRARPANAQSGVSGTDSPAPVSQTANSAQGSVKPTLQDRHLPSSVPLPIPFHFTGRSDEIADLHARLRAGRQRVAIHGLHGVGKTTVAAAYAAQYKGDYRAIGWIDAETAVGCASGLIQLGQRLGLGLANATEQDVEHVIHHITSKEHGILLIFDNAISPRHLLKYIPAGDKVHILITSNSPNWRSVADCIRLEPWSAGEGAQFLESRLGSTDPQSIELSRELGGLPIALENCAAYCERRSLSLKSVLIALRQETASSIRISSHQTIGYRSSIATTFQMSIAAAMSEHPGSVPLLQALCLLSPGWIPHVLIENLSGELMLEDGAPFSNLDVTEAMASLQNYSLISRDYTLGKPDWWSAKVHRFLRRLVLPTIDDTPPILQALAAALCKSAAARPPLKSMLEEGVDDDESYAFGILRYFDTLYCVDLPLQAQHVLAQAKAQQIDTPATREAAKRLPYPLFPGLVPLVDSRRRRKEPVA